MTGKKPDHSQTYAVVGELVMIANAIDQLLNQVLISVFNLAETPLLAPVVATLSPRQKIEMLKSRAKHITNAQWKKSIMDFCKAAESVSDQRNIVCHTPAVLNGDVWSFKPAAAAKMFNKLNLEKKTINEFPFNDIKTAISTGEETLGAGIRLLYNFEKFNAELQRRKIGLPIGV